MFSFPKGYNSLRNPGNTENDRKKEHMAIVSGLICQILCAHLFDSEIYVIIYITCVIWVYIYLYENVENVLPRRIKSFPCKVWLEFRDQWLSEFPWIPGGFEILISESCPCLQNTLEGEKKCSYFVCGCFVFPSALSVGPAVRLSPLVIQCV